MQLSTFFVTVLATAVLASPSKRNYGGGEGGTPTPYDACSGLYDSLQCCATDVLGVADLDCGTRKAFTLLEYDSRPNFANYPFYSSRWSPNQPG